MKKLFTLFICGLLSVAAAFADEPFRNHRYDAFKVLPINNESIVFVGNSITNMNEWWETFSSNHNIVNRGVSGAYSDEALANIEAIAVGKPKKVFFMIGTNDLGTNGKNTTEYVLKHITLLVDRLQKVSPETEIYIQSILPSNNGLRTLAIEQETNAALQALCQEKEVTYIDLWEDLLSITKNHNHTLDGLHLKASGYQIWAKKIEQYVGSTCSYPDDCVTVQSNGGIGNAAYGMRATVFSTLPVNEGDILIIGDEMIHGGEWHELLQSGKVKSRGTGWGHPGPGLDVTLNEIPLILNSRSGSCKPSKILLYAGVSEVCGNTNIADIETKYKSIVNKIKELAPEAKLYLLSHQPTNTANTNTNRVVAFNEKIKAIATADTNIEYIDIYTDFVSNNVGKSEYFTGNYLYGKGYVKVAQKIATAINDENVVALTDEQADHNYRTFELRSALGRAIVTAALLREGNNVGEYTAESLAELKSLVETAYTLLKEGGETAEFETLAASITTAANAAYDGLVMPKASTEENEYWYQITSQRSPNRYITAKGEATGVTGETSTSTQATSMWKFVKRADNTYDIVNREYNSYLNPVAAYNSQITTVKTKPANGWSINYANNPGCYIISSGEVQLNQTQEAQSYKLYNWSKSDNKGNDRNDTGCQLFIMDAKEITDPALTLTPTEFANNQATWSYHGTTNSGAWYGKFVTNTTPALSAESTDNNANNIGWASHQPWLQPGYTYNLNLSDGYTITGYELTTKIVNVSNSSYTCTFNYTTAEGTATSEPQDDSERTIKVSGLETDVISLTLDGTVSAQKGILITKLVIYYKQVAVKELEYTIDKTNGNLYRDENENQVNQNWTDLWKSNKTPQLKFGCGPNNMHWAGNNIELMTGGSSCTYTLTAPAGYAIAEYSFTFTNNNHEEGLGLTMENGDLYTTSKTPQTISANNQSLNSISFTINGPNSKGVVLTDFTVKIKSSVMEAPTISTENDVHWYYITSASTKDYCKDKVIYYDEETSKLRFGDKTFSADRIWSFWEKDGKLTIKNYKDEYFGTAGAGTGGSTSFGVVSEPNYIYYIQQEHGAFIIKDNAVELHAQQNGQTIVRWAAEANGASLWKFDEVDTSNALAKLSSTRVVQGKVSTGIGNTNQPIIRSTIKVSGLEGEITFQGVKGTFVGSDSNDITNVKAYFATNERELFIDSDKKMAWRDENGVQFGETVTLKEDGTFTITGTKKLAPGDNYLWITYDIAETAKEGNTVDAVITAYTIDGKEVAENNGNPAHSVTVFLSEGAVLMPMDKGSLYYRIPAITVTKDGKRLVTLTDDRKQHNSDLPSHCYLVAQYSEDNGRTWSDPVTVAGTAETGGNYGHGDASIVTNRENGEIVGIMTSAGTYGHGFFAGTAAEPPRWKTITSRDGGLTWETPVDHTDDLFGANCSNPDTKTWKSGFSGSGAALQKRDGTLVSSFVNRQADNSQHFYFFMSKDGGQSWYVSGTSGTSGADEPKTLERNNGDLAISVRASGYNYYNYTSDNGATWHLPSQTRFTSGISGNACDGEYMVWCSTVEGNPWDIAFQTLPNSSSRQNVSIALSTDEGATFGTPKTICPIGSAYSAAVVLPDGTLGVYYEENGVFGGFTMRFVRFSLDWASNGTYKFTEESPFYPIKSTNPTEIEEVTEQRADSNAIYDLQGRKVENPTKGMYIINGKKIMF